MNQKLSQLLPPIILLEWGGIFLYFYLSGRLSAFLHPSYRLPVLLAGGVFVFCAVVLFLTRNQKTSIDYSPDASRSPVVATWIFPFMLLLPMGIAATFAKDTYGSNILLTRGIADSAAELPGLADQFAKAFPKAELATVEPALPSSSSSDQTPPPIQDTTADDFFKPDANGNIQVNVADLLYAAEEPTLRKPFSGKSAEIVGQFMPAKSNNPTGNRFKLVRLFMNCCAADAQPVSLLIERDLGQPLPAKVGEMAWTKVVGEISFPIENGRTIAIIKAREIEPIDPPEESMLY